MVIDPKPSEPIKRRQHAIQLPARSKTNWPRLAVIVLAVLLAGWWVLRQAAGKGQGWDYSFRDIEMTAPLSAEMTAYDDDRLRKSLNDAGGDGWELVSVVASPRPPIEKGYAYRLIFKRPGALHHRAEGQTSYDPERARKAIEAESKARAQALERELEEIKQGRSPAH